MPVSLNAALAFAQENKARFLSELVEFVSIPSVSTDPEAKPAIQQAAEWVAGQLKALGMDNVQVMPTEKHPVVYGEFLGAGPDKPVVLIYGHYDVQPAEPLELWHSPAFVPEQRGDNLYGRGASDMKGQVMTTLKACEALASSGDLPVNLKWLIEGEEEIGSPSLGKFIAEHTQLLACDFAINPDTGMIAPDVPTITYGLRGLAYFEIRVIGPTQDLHSGLFGGSVHNPAQVLCELIAGMHDEQGRITLPGYYDRVRPLEEAERQEMKRLPNDDAFFLDKTGAPNLFGEAGYSAVERVGGRPTLEVNGLLSGFTGEGSKTVLPSKAMAKISMRLVPDQDPKEVQQQLRRYLEEHAPDTIRWELLMHAGAPASVADISLPAVATLAQAMEDSWGKRPVYKREGGSVPVVSQMKDLLGVESVLTGFGLPDDNLHAPNEKIHLPTYFKGIEVFIRYLALLGEE